MSLRSLEPESNASANSAISAYPIFLSTLTDDDGYYIVSDGDCQGILKEILIFLFGNHVVLDVQNLVAPSVP